MGSLLAYSQVSQSLRMAICYGESLVRPGLRTLGAVQIYIDGTGVSLHLRLGVLSTGGDQHFEVW
jgi:hypothetical protein